MRNLTDAAESLPLVILMAGLLSYHLEMTTWVANTFNIGYSFLQGLPATKFYISTRIGGTKPGNKKVPISTNVLTDTVKTLITVLGT